MLEQIMKYIRNYFPTGRYLQGTFEITQGSLVLSNVENGTYIKIEGSTKGNDGVYIYQSNDSDLDRDADEIASNIRTTNDLTDETFNGYIALLEPPAEFISLVGEIEIWSEENKNSVTSPYQSESFGGYSYSKQIGSSDWTSVFAERLRPWRKI